MARKKPEPKPLLAVKHDFVDSLDNIVQQSINLLQLVDQALDLDLVKEPIKDRLREQAKKFRNSLVTDD